MWEDRWFAVVAMALATIGVSLPTGCASTVERDEPCTVSILPDSGIAECSAGCDVVDIFLVDEERGCAVVSRHGVCGHWGDPLPASELQCWEGPERRFVSRVELDEADMRAQGYSSCGLGPPLCE